jgi:CheY-like chemotaxis protein
VTNLELHPTRAKSEEPAFAGSPATSIRPHMPRARFLPLALYIDDSQNDRALVQLAVELSKVDLEFRCLGDVAEGVDYLTGRGRFADRRQHPLPVFILVDYHLNGCTGAEFLGWLRAQPQFTAIPVCVYSDADSSEPVGNCYRAGADHFLIKARTFDRLMAVIRALGLCTAWVPPCLDLLIGLPEHRYPELKHDIHQSAAVTHRVSSHWPPVDAHSPPL